MGLAKNEKLLALFTLSLPRCPCFFKLSHGSSCFTPKIPITHSAAPTRKSPSSAWSMNPYYSLIYGFQNCCWLTVPVELPPQLWWSCLSLEDRTEDKGMDDTDHSKYDKQQPFDVHSETNYTGNYLSRLCWNISLLLCPMLFLDKR